MKKLIFILTLVITWAGMAQEENPKPEFDTSFVHVVYFWLNNSGNAEDRQTFETSLKKLAKTSLYTKTNFMGYPPKATRDVVDDSYTYAYIVTFESAEAQESYQTEAAHMAFIEEANHLWKKVVVYDSKPITE